MTSATAATARSSLLLAALIAAPARAGEVAEVAGRSVLADCVTDAACGLELGELAADTLRSAGLATETLGIELSPAVVRGSGPTLGMSAQTLAMPRFVPPSGVQLAPVVPRIAVGGVGGSLVRYGGALEVGGAVPWGRDAALGGDLRGEVVFGSPDGRRWIGFGADGGYAEVRGALFDDPARALSGLPGGAGLDPKPCIQPCTDALRLAHVGVDSVLAFDVDPTIGVTVRIGGVFAWDALDAASDLTTWTWSGKGPRLTLGGAYRPSSRATVAAGVKVALLEPSATTNRSRLPWIGSLSASWRFGAAELPTRAAPRPPGVTPPPAPNPALTPPVIVPLIPVVNHPDLQCDAEQIPTGAVPPTGTKAYCVKVTPDGRILWDGPFLEWHGTTGDAAIQIRRRGQFANGKEVGVWTEYDASGRLSAQGAYEDGLRIGVWTTYGPDGELRSSGRFEKGTQTGEWQYWYEDGRSALGQWGAGLREGLWIDYDATGRPVRERTFHADVMISDHWL